MFNNKNWEWDGNSATFSNFNFQLLVNELDFNVYLNVDHQKIAQIKKSYGDKNTLPNIAPRGKLTPQP